MKDHSSLSEHFQKLLKSSQLSDGEIEDLAQQLLASESLGSDNAELLCHAASVLYKYGILKQEPRPLLLALSKLMQAEELYPLLFELTSYWRQLWGNIFVQLSHLLYDYSFVEKGLLQFAKAAEVEDRKPQLFWDWADAWLLSGVHSSEHCDLKRALETFSKAFSLGCHSPLFRVDFAIAHMIFGLHTGEPSYLEEALSLLRGVIADTYDPEAAVSSVQAKAWVSYALAMKRRYSLTHLQKDFEEADKTFREAILTLPAQVDLWLDWGELYLYAGWLKQDLKAIEIGLDKLTSSKIKEGDPLRVSALLGKSLVFFGLFLDDLKLIHDGKERILAAFELAPKHPELLTALAYAEFGLGVYFSEGKEYAKAALHFEERIDADSTSVAAWHGLFQTYLKWGMLEEDLSLVQKGIRAIARLCQLRPHSALYLHEWGVSLLQLRNLDKNLDKQQAAIEEAILKFKQAYALHEDQEVLYNLGCAFDQLGDLTGNEEDYEKAIDILSEVLEADSNEPHVCYNLALVLSHLGELSGNVERLYQAVELFEPLAEADPEDGRLWSDLGYTLLNLSELVYDPVHPEKRETLRREAEERLLHAVEEGNGDANYHLACLYSLTGLVEVSMQYLKRAETLDALPPQEDLVHDEWLANVRETDLFKEFMLW